MLSFILSVVVILEFCLGLVAIGLMPKENSHEWAVAVAVNIIPSALWFGSLAIANAISKSQKNK